VPEVTTDIEEALVKEQQHEHLECIAF